MTTTRKNRKSPPVAPLNRQIYFNSELRELWVRGTLVKRLDIRATNQILVLTVFQEDDWAVRIDDPMHPKGGDDKARLRDTIYSLNGGQHPFLIHFFADGSGHGIRWEFVAVNESSRRKLNNRQQRCQN